jgi:FMN phosphatase YigB (HAD superfamily)/DNA-binding XRE family transcriptional regulator
MAMHEGGKGALVGALDEKSLGKRLQAARQAAGLTQQNLCQRANLSYSTLAKIERGAIKSPSIFTVQTIAAALGVSLDTLLGIHTQHASHPVAAKHVSKSGVRFVYFDVNGCLVRFFHQAFTKLAHESGEPPDMVESAYWHYNDQVCRGAMSLHEFNKALAKSLHIPSVNWQEEYLDTVEPVLATQEVVEWASRHYHIGLLTNIMPGFVDAMLKRKLIPDVPYDSIIDSSQVGAIKPEKKIYEIAAERAGCKPEEILLVDDSRANLMAAEHLGWHVLWFDAYRSKESIERIRKALEQAE